MNPLANWKKLISNDIIDTLLVSLALTLYIFHTFFSVSTIDFEQINVCWKKGGLPKTFLKFLKACEKWTSFVEGNPKFLFFEGCCKSVLFKYVDLICVHFKFLKYCAQHAEFKIKETAVERTSRERTAERTTRERTSFWLALPSGALSVLLIKRASVDSLLKCSAWSYIVKSLTIPQKIRAVAALK